MKRKCEACPAEVMAVCRYAFGKFWNDKSRNGAGCDHPVDELAEAWRKDGWTPPGEGATAPEPTMPRRPATVSLTQLKMPRRPVRRTVQGSLI